MDGYIIGVANMTEPPPHNGERHTDGDEVLYLISGRVEVMFESEPTNRVELKPGDGLIVPRGVWHRVNIIEPCQILHIKPGPNNEVRPL